ncbi:hypothetical protein [Deinococcus budaensis]|uniref:WD40 repeat protein n=1 Tax=Deinococcus budaensis TaxID=1665626 RepID=A0A7W8GC38_9DEIO|nr:hypothetical protein [Deinococcus budaensis]MBB5232753.1 WD40 repeat protein [Deinococcus budaensis]
MLALLLALTAPQGGSLTIGFGAAGSVKIDGLTPWYDERVYHDPPLMSPRGDAAALRFCHDFAKYQPCTVYLAQPGQPVQTLKNSNVQRLLWTGDGQYLIGAGANTVRLWNLSAGGRAAVPYPVLTGKQRSVSQIERLWFRDRDLCVAMSSEVFGPNGGYATGRLTTTTRYALPTLQPLTVTTLEGSKKEAECRPSTSSALWP